MTILDATHKWVSEFNAIPQGVMVKLMRNDETDVTEITPLGIGDCVDVWSDEYYGDGEIVGYNQDDDTYSVHTDDDTYIEVSPESIQVQYDDVLPMWGTMWTFGDMLDDLWLEEDNGLQLMADCGFRIYQQEDFGYIFGIDGAGYDFYEAHWVPLYKARGLRWHTLE